jgi:putative PIN family toxin of toxin-antitoxin system
VDAGREIMKVVIDTNILISSLSSRSSSHWVIDAFISEQFVLVISNDILLEYEEKLREKYSEPTVENFLEAINIAVNVQKMYVHYNWNLISDADDNKFSDCVIQSGADYLVTETGISKFLSK